MPQRVLDSAEDFEPAMQGLAPDDGVWIGIAGLDIVRDGDGPLARAGGQRAHAERARLLADRARRDARAGSTRRRSSGRARSTG